MIVPVYGYGNAVLREVSKDIKPDYPKLNEFIANMWETLKNADGVGLAASQVGYSIRLFLIDAEPLSKAHKELKGFKKAFINAHILKQEGDLWSYNEGCLSLPSIREDVSRKPKITVKYVDENFVIHEEIFEGIKARIFQHEYDHLEGILIPDRISQIRRTLIKRKLNNIITGNVKVSYKMKFAKTKQ
ncbi:MAG: peptide deformylase [Bacteroidetes bacterium]|nr:peptide deformylase [Bacteroidota bacterium]